MGDERDGADSSRPKCPKCGFPDAARLAPSDALLRWQCRNHDCLYQWNTSRPGYRPAPAPVIDSRRLKEDEVVAMASEATDKSDRTCPKCTKTFKFPSWMKDHIGKCKGDAPPARATRKRPPPPRASAALAAKTMALIQIVTEVPDHLKGTTLEPAVAMLLDQQKLLELQLAETKGAITAISKLQPVEAGSRPT